MNQRGISEKEWKLFIKESNEISKTKNYTIWNLSPSHDLNIILEIVEGNMNKLEEESVAAIFFFTVTNFFFNFILFLNFT